MRTVSIRQGFITSLPLTVSGGVFGIIFGFTGAAGQLPLEIVSAMSVIIFAGSAQFITLLLFIQEQPLFGIIVAATIINLRHMIYAAVMKDMLSWKGMKRMVIGYFLTDEAFLATTIVEKEARQAEAKVMVEWVFLGAGVTLWIVWNITTIVGYLVYEVFEDLVSFPENFVITASFVGFLVDHWRKYPEERWLIASLGIISIPLGFLFSSTWTLVILMLLGGALGSTAQYKRMQRGETDV